MQFKIKILLFWLLVTACQDNLNNDSDSTSDSSTGIDTIRYSDVETYLPINVINATVKKNIVFMPSI